MFRLKRINYLDITMTIKYTHQNSENESWLDKKLAYPNNTIISHQVH